MLHHPEWKVNDDALVALGFIVEGYGTEIKTYTYKRTLIASHYISINSQSDGLLDFKRSANDLDQYFEPILKALIKGILDENKLAQQSASFALTAVQVRPVHFKSYL